MWTTTIAEAGIETALELVTYAQIMGAPEADALGKIPGCTIGRAVGWLEESASDGSEVLTLRRKRCLSAIHNLVEVIETSLIKVVLALAERTDQHERRSATTEAAVVADGRVASSEIQHALGRGVVDVRRKERRLIGLRRIAEDREVKRVVLIDVVVSFQRIVIGARTSGVVAKQRKQSGIVRAS